MYKELTLYIRFHDINKREDDIFMKKISVAFLSFVVAVSLLMNMTAQAQTSSRILRSDDGKISITIDATMTINGTTNGTTNSTNSTNSTESTTNSTTTQQGITSSGTKTNTQLITATGTLKKTNGKYTLTESYLPKFSLNYKTVNFNNMSKKDQETIEAKKLTKGTITLNNGEYSYIVVFSGQKPSGGHKIAITNLHVEQIIDTSGKIQQQVSVYFTETPPAQGSLTASVISYPMAIIKVRTDSIKGYSVKSVPTSPVVSDDDLTFELKNVPGQANMLPMDQDVNKKITVRGLLENGTKNIQALYFYIKPEVETQELQFVQGKIKMLNDYDNYYYIEASNGVKTFLVGDLSEVDDYLNLNIELNGRKREGRSPNKLKEVNQNGLPIFEVKSLSDKFLKSQKVSTITGKLTKANGNYIVTENSKNYQLTGDKNILNKLDTYKDKNITILGLLKDANTLEVYYFFEKPLNEKIQNQNVTGQVTGYQFRDLTVGTEMLYYLKTEDNKTLLIHGDKNKHKGSLNKKVTLSGKYRDGKTSNDIKVDNIFEISGTNNSDPNLHTVITITGKVTKANGKFMVTENSKNYHLTASKNILDKLDAYKDKNITVLGLLEDANTLEVYYFFEKPLNETSEIKTLTGRLVSVYHRDMQKGTALLTYIITSDNKKYLIHSDKNKRKDSSNNSVTMTDNSDTITGYLRNGATFDKKVDKIFELSETKNPTPPNPGGGAEQEPTTNLLRGLLNLIITIFQFILKALFNFNG
jgi:hypothetical protein